MLIMYDKEIGKRAFFLVLRQEIGSKFSIIVVVSNE
jgi:hypothetical protein